MAKRKNSWLLLRLFLCGFGFVSAAAVAEPRPAFGWLDFAVLVAVVPLVLLAIIGVQALNPWSRPSWSKPNWSDNFLALGDPLRFFHFASFFFLASAAGSLASSLLSHSEQFGSAKALLAAGVGGWIGVRACTHVYVDEQPAALDGLGGARH